MYRILISYDLIRPNKDYQNLYDYLKRTGTWAKPLESVWIIKTDKTCEQVINEIEKHVDENDKVLAINISNDTITWLNLSQNVSDWLQN
ncbi:MAG: hypothetical protein PHR39_01025 [Actinomycetota bacterium]|nr:hypothetical protein [Actinomycetota bacterium]